MRIVRDIFLVVVGIVLFLSNIFLVFPFFGMSTLGSEVTARGVAVAKQCRFSGPVTETRSPEREFMTGWWWICDARVRWDDGRVEMREIVYSQLTDADIGREVEVVAREEIASRAGATRSVVYRADFEPKPVWAGVAMVVVSVVGLFVGFPGAYRLVRRIQGKSPELPKT
ncbi:hypothetical protein DFQ14_11730 [Halopolyspora algeriensis]|uniref:Uncharacterized protein n=1 Tax=Halopolyspora algeriensis TaxID=1500506 RepID=A0A368VHR6_9ACTN|nr:DUF6346 domain-containing protein [Halopolyspora algeriensis]RCW39194.1 hypothetical protein DFQ14_11730 [Halopolyspora algeriensis]TQM47439.1 hypothetical protein FHU43_3427 [Halopolyspora algeriensis]